MCPDQKWRQWSGDDGGEVVMADGICGVDTGMEEQQISLAEKLPDDAESH